MIHRLLRIPIGIRLGIGVLLVQLMLVAWMTWDSRQVAIAALEQQQSLRVAELSALLNDALAPLMVQRDFAALQDVLENVGRAEGLEYLLLYDGRDQLVASYASMDREEVAQLQQNAVEFSLLDTHVPIRLYGQQYGLLQVGISTRLVEELRQSLMRRGMQTALFGVLLLLLVIMPISLCLSRRLGRLAEAAQAIASGDLQKRLQDRSRDELGQLVDAFNHMAASLEQRIAELSQAGMEREKVIDALGIANRDLQRLSEVTAHHMREPLRRLITYSQRLQQQCGELPDSDEMGVSVSVLEQQARKMAALVRDVERYLSAGQPEGPLAWQQTAPLISARAEALCQEHGLDPAVVSCGELPSLYMDRPRLGLLFELLIDNALRYRHAEHAPKVRVEGWQLGDRIVYNISDNGPGIAPGYRERLFSIFERMEVGGHGTGAGLSIARRIVESLNGRIWLESNDEGGTTVVLELPLIVDTE